MIGTFDLELDDNKRLICIGCKHDYTEVLNFENCKCQCHQVE
jgi:hypothetical protein